MPFEDPAHVRHPILATFIGIVLVVVGLLVSFFQFARVDLYTPLQNAALYSGPEDAGYWKVLRRAYIRGDPTTLFLSDKHLNDWALGVFSEGSLKAQKSNIYSAWPETPIFRVRKGKLSILVPIRVSIFGMEREKPFLLQARGSFKKMEPLTGGPLAFRFVPNSLLFGAAHIPQVDWMRSFFVTSISHIFTQTQEYRELYPTWLKLTKVDVSGDRLVISRPE